MDEEKITKIKESENIKGIKFSICKMVSGYLYDIIGEGSLRDLERLKKALDIESKIIENSVFGTSLIVVDTTFDLDAAKYSLKKIIEKWSEVE